MKIGLFFGSFNPIHIGHLIIANTIITQNDEVDKVWFVVSPQNPMKNKKTLLPVNDRIDLVREAIHDDYSMEVSDIEVRMTMPSYTINTLVLLEEKYPNHEFYPILGQDNLFNFHKWKNHTEIIKNRKIFVYPRVNAKPTQWDDHPAFTLTNSPLISISSSYIRALLKDNHSVRYLLPKEVEELIVSRYYYK